MKEKFKMFGIVGGWVTLLLVVGYGVSWLVTCGLIKLITMCFDLTFSCGIATGIWLITIILKSIFKSNTTVNTKK